MEETYKDDAAAEERQVECRHLTGCLSIICGKSIEHQGSQQPQKTGKSDSDPEQSTWIGHGEAGLCATLLIQSCHPATPVPKETDEQLLSTLDDSSSVNPRLQRRATWTRMSDNFHTS